MSALPAIGLTLLAIGALLFVVLYFLGKRVHKQESGRKRNAGIVTMMALLLSGIGFLSLAMFVGFFYLNREYGFTIAFSALVVWAFLISTLNSRYASILKREV